DLGLIGRIGATVDAGPADTTGRNLGLVDIGLGGGLGGGTTTGLNLGLLAIALGAAGAGGSGLAGTTVTDTRGFGLIVGVGGGGDAATTTRDFGVIGITNTGFETTMATQITVTTNGANVVLVAAAGNIAANAAVSLQAGVQVIAVTSNGVVFVGTTTSAGFGVTISTSTNFQGVPRIGLGADSGNGKLRAPLGCFILLLVGCALAV
ncbi:hypothetical protein OXX69_008824, partial [Metschnikowia pulcherrima]